MQILFVCTGNICRSPIAERLAAAYAHEIGAEGLQFSSAGTQAVIGSPVHPLAALVLESLGGDASGFAARQLTPRIASAADLIITMTAAHRDAALERSPALMRRTFTICEAAYVAKLGDASAVGELPHLRVRIPKRELSDVKDPMGQDVGVFEAVGGQIATFVAPIVDMCNSWKQTRANP